MRAGRSGGVLGGLWLVSVLACAQEGTIGLMDAYEAARGHDAQFRSAQAEREAGREYAAISRSRLLPTVSAVVSENRNRATVTNTGGGRQDRGSYNSSTNNLLLRQPLYDREAWVAHRQGKARSAASEATYRLRLQELALRTTEAYTQVLLAQDEVHLIEVQLNALEELYRANEQRFQHGEGTRTEMLETQAKRAVVQTRLNEAQDLAANRRVALESLTGMRVHRLQRLHPLPREGAAAREQTLEAWRHATQSYNPELESLRYALTIAQEEVLRLGAGHHPRVDMTVSVGRSQSDTTATFQQTSTTRTVGVQLSIPLYGGGGVSAQVRQALAQRDKAEADLAARQEEMNVDLHRQYSLQSNGPARLEALLQAVRANEELVDATLRSVAGGERTNVDVLNARERLSLAQRDLLEARYGYLLAGLRLRHIAGTLEDDDLRELSRKFGPQEAVPIAPSS